MNLIKLSNDLEYEYIIKPNTRAKKLILRVDLNGIIAITTPKKGYNNKKIESFIRDHETWIIEKFNNKIEKVIFKNQDTFTLFDEIYTIKHTNISRGLTKFDQETKILSINCKPEFLHRRVCKWIKTYILEYFSNQVSLYANQLQKTYTTVKVKNTKTRWGSCSSKGTISLCWLLAFAPKYVCDYVIAHECTHLQHLNHSPAFWHTLTHLFPQTAQAERWLKRHGKSLFAYY